MIDGYTAGNVGQDRMTLIVNGEKEIAAGREADSSNVLAMGKGQSVGFVAVVSSQPSSSMILGKTLLWHNAPA